MLSEAFWTLNIVSLQSDEYSQLGSQRKVCPIKNQLGSPNTSKQVHEQTFAQLRTGFRQQTSWLLTVTTTYSGCKASRVYREEAMYRSLLPMPTTTCLLTDRQDYQAKGDHLPFSSFLNSITPTRWRVKKKKKKEEETLKKRKERRREGGWSVVQNGQSLDSQHCGWLTELWQSTQWLIDGALTDNTMADWLNSDSQHCGWLTELQVNSVCGKRQKMHLTCMSQLPVT